MWVLPLATVDKSLDIIGCCRYNILSRFGAGVAQLVERQLPKLDVAGSSPVARSISFCSW